MSTRSIHQLIETITELPRAQYAKLLADKYGLVITSVSWDDSARTKFSSWGPCISDITLQVGERCMPIVRTPNFEDLTWDLPIESIPLIVGNQSDGIQWATNLKTYLGEYWKFLSFDTGSRKPLVSFSDTHVIASAQACILPVEETGETPFNVCIFNYQAQKNNPAVLAIVATSKGTSAQILDQEQRTGQKLFFNKNGKRCSFLAQSLSQNRVENNKMDLDAPMTSEEKQENVILIIQVPLRQKASLPTEANRTILKSLARFEDAIVKIAPAEGPFEELKGLKDLERNPDYPIRVTYQFYKASADGCIDDEIIGGLHKQLLNARKNCTNIGSLVVGQSNRPTEMKKIPLWWTNFWLTYRNSFRMSEEELKQLVFPQFSDSPLSVAQPEIIRLYSKSINTNPVWNV